MSFSRCLILSLQIPRCPFPGISLYSYRFPNVIFKVSNSFLTDYQISFSRYLILSLKIPNVLSGISFFPYRFPNVLFQDISFFPYRFPYVLFKVSHSFLTDSQISFSRYLILSLPIQGILILPYRFPNVLFQVIFCNGISHSLLPDYRMVHSGSSLFNSAKKHVKMYRNCFLRIHL